MSKILIKFDNDYSGPMGGGGGGINFALTAEYSAGTLVSSNSQSV